MWRLIRSLIARIFGFKEDTEEVCETTLLTEDEREEIKKEAERDFWGEV